ncbi:MAG: SOS response-associated peptidase family protein [Clostridia bacterium]|nr:SOS response-associated peptidase family protein [Clostridia bacterium]
MCCRFYISSLDANDLLEEYISELNRTVPLGEIHPGDLSPVLAPGRETRKAKPFLMRWGFSMDRKLVINCRSESAAEKPMFRESFRSRRCLIPARWYWEWDHAETPPARYRYELDRPFVFLAGIYRLEGREPVFTVLTREASEDVQGHHDRMPVMLDITRETVSGYLDSGTDPSDLLSHALLHVTPVREGKKTPEQLKLQI